MYRFLTFLFRFSIHTNRFDSSFLTKGASRMDGTPSCCHNSLPKAFFAILRIRRDANAYTFASLRVRNSMSKLIFALLQICRDANVYAFASLRVHNFFSKFIFALLQICRDANAYAFASLLTCRAISNEFSALL